MRKRIFFIIFLCLLIVLYLLSLLFVWIISYVGEQKVVQNILANENVESIYRIENDDPDGKQIYKVWLIMKDGTKITLSKVKISHDTRKLEYGDIPRIGKYSNFAVCIYLSHGFEVMRACYTLDQYPVCKGNEKRFDVNEFLNNVPIILSYFSTLPCVSDKFRSVILTHDYNEASELSGLDLMSEYKIGYKFFFTYEADEVSPWPVEHL